MKSQQTKKKKAALHNLGCKVNSYECEAMEEILKRDGYEIVPFTEEADVYVINTCTVTNTASHKSRQMIHRAKRLNPDALVVAAGCWVQLNADDAAGDDAIDIVIGNNEKSRLIEMIEAARAGKESVLLEDINKGTKEYEKLAVTSPRGRSRAFVKIQDGCNRFCSYCAIPYARGRVRSRDPRDVLDEVKALAANGYKEIVISGIHICSYGTEWKKSGTPDIAAGWGLLGKPSEALLHIIREVSEFPEIERIRLGSLEPGMVTEEFVRGIKDIKKVCPHFHLSLQNGSDTVLKRMNRHYTTEEYYERVCLLREEFGNPSFTTDMITGFPGETDEEFAETLDFAKKVGFYEMHVFPYSVRAGTNAEKLPGRVPDNIKKTRTDALLKLSRELKEKYLAGFYGKELEVLFEDEDPVRGDGFYRGFSREYIRVIKKYEECVTGRIMKVVFSPDLY